VKFLIDNALSPAFAKVLIAAGHDAVHLRDLGKQDASDETVFALAHDADRILVSADTDFGTLLALRQTAKPSVVLLRHFEDRDPVMQARLLLANLAPLQASLEAGAVVVIDPQRIRVRTLPI